METIFGTIKSYGDAKGYGWISSENQKDVFFHISGLAEKFFPKIGDFVSYEISQDKLGRNKAVNVRKIETNNNGMELTNAEQTEG